MKTFSVKIVALAAAVMMFAGSPALAQEGGAEKPAAAGAVETGAPINPMADMTPEQMAEIEAAMMEQANPAPEHRNYEPLIGNWRFSSTMSMGPGEPMTSQGMAENTWILGGRFVQHTSKSDAGEAFQFETMSVFGFDRRFERYTQWGIDTMGTYSVSAAGPYDAQTKTFTFEGEFEMPGFGMSAYRWLVTIVSNDRNEQRIFFRLPDGTWPAAPGVVIVQDRIAGGKTPESAGADLSGGGEAAAK